jgi:LPS-assembly protein
MRNLKNEKRKIDINNIFAVNRIGFDDTVEPGQSLTIGAEYKKTSNKNDYTPIKFNLATVFRDSAVENMPLTSSLGNKSSDVIGGVSLSTKKKFNADYNFALDNNLDALKYSDFSGSFNVNNFVTTFRYIEENDNIGDENYIQNDTSFKLNENSSILFSTRRNKKIDLTEYYNLIYQYKNDCLTAAIKYKKDFYIDNDIKPTEEIFFSLTIVPLGAYETKSVK